MTLFLYTIIAVLFAYLVASSWSRREKEYCEENRRAIMNYIECCKCRGDKP